MRTSFLDGSKTLLKRFDSNDEAVDYSEDLVAGGGYVYLNTTGDGPGHRYGAATSVLRISRDGSIVQKVASGLLKTSDDEDIITKGRSGQLNDCGTSAAAEYVTGDGSVVIRETTSERESKACGRKKNIDHERLYLLSPSGQVREILREDLRIKLTIKFKKHGWEAEVGSVIPAITVVSVTGDRVLLSKGRGFSFYVRDLSTGVETGPYKSAVASKSNYDLVNASLDPSGRVAYSSFGARGDRKHLRFRHTAGVFQTAGDPSSFKKNKGFSFVFFCGSRLLSSSARGVSELDPVTFNLIRKIAPAHKGDTGIDLESACSPEYLYMRSWDGGERITFLAYPLR